MKTIFLVLLTGLISLSGICQITFRKIIPCDNSEEAYSILQTYDGGYAILGEITIISGNYSYLTHLIKLNKFGDTLWTRTYPGSVPNYESMFKQTTDSGFIFCTYHLLPGDTGFYLVKTSSTGDTAWTRKYQEISGTSIELTPDQGYIISGGSVSISQGYHMVNLKTDANGNEIWRKIYHPVSSQYFNPTPTAISNTNDGGYIICGNISGFESRSIFVIKTDNNGDSIWSRIFSREQYQGAYSVFQLDDNGYIIGGYIAPSVSYYDDQGYLIRLNESGDTLWTKPIGINEIEYFNSVQNIPSGEIIACGVSGSDDYRDILLEKIDLNGIVRWKRIFRDPVSSSGNSVKPTGDGGFVLCGSRGKDIIIIKTDSVGILTGTHGITGENRHFEIYPNPCLSSATISFTSHFSEPVQIDLFSLQGNLIRNMVSNQFPTGQVKFNFDTGNLLPGIFLVRFVSGDITETRKLIVIN